MVNDDKWEIPFFPEPQDDTLVEVLLGDGDTVVRPANEFDWGICGDESDIIKWMPYPDGFTEEYVESRGWK